MKFNRDDTWAFLAIGLILATMALYAMVVWARPA